MHHEHEPLFKRPHYSTFEKSLAIDKVHAAIKNLDKQRRVRTLT
jgi:hypothetical protein